jgi:hypothetical protein
MATPVLGEPVGFVEAVVKNTKLEYGKVELPLFILDCHQHG